MRPVPDMLKPAYNFGGMSMLQLMMPYVQRYQRTADSISDLVHAFSLTILATDMSSILAGDNDPNTLLRAGLFNKHRDNTGLMLLDKEAEEISQINTPLTGLPELLRQAQEQMAAPSHTPLVKLLGVTPNGLGASAEGEIEVYRDYISAQNEAHIRPVIERISELMQLSLFGEIDQSIRWEFEPLKQMDAKELAEIQEIKSRSNTALIDAGIISAEEARQALSDDAHSGYSSIVVSDVPERENYQDDDLML
jgi:phage-related protein (TIGR01555 family)